MEVKGKFFSEALILASVNPQATIWQEIVHWIPRKIQVHNMLCTKIVFLFWHSKQYLYTTSCELVLFREFNEQMNNLSSYCGLTDSRMRASDTDLPAFNYANNKYYL